MPEFNYKQRIVEDKKRFDKNYEKVVGEDKAESDLKKILGSNYDAFKDAEKDIIKESKTPLLGNSFEETQR